MKAWQVHEFGPYREVLRYEEADEPAAPEKGAVIAVDAAGLNFPDMLLLAGKYQVKPALPFGPGLEGVGRVASVGPASERKVGERVIFNAPWGACADKLAVTDDRIFSCPESLSSEHAAALMITYQTAYFGLVHRAHLRDGETLLVHGGAGGVGTAAIQVGKALGARVIATAGTADKLAICRNAGADLVINYREEDFVAIVKRETGGGADVIFDPVGGDVFDKSSKCIAFSGRLLVIGFASGRIPEIAANRILLKNMAVVGLHWGDYFFRQPELIGETHEALLAMIEKKQIEPIVCRTYPMSELIDGLAMIESRDSYGKVVVTN